LVAVERIEPGDEFTLLDVGGVFILSPRRTEVDALAERITRAFNETGESLESMLLQLREERERLRTRPGDADEG
jgi:hypothetical protein